MRVVNPKTKRPVTVGGRAWRNLVNEGVLPLEPQQQYLPPDCSTVKDEKCLGEIDEEDMTPEEIEEKLKGLGEALEPGFHAVKGRGRYKGKAVKRRTMTVFEQAANARQRIKADDLADSNIIITGAPTEPDPEPEPATAQVCATTEPEPATTEASAHTCASESDGEYY
jgi:hypothetical protein